MVEARPLVEFGNGSHPMARRFCLYGVDRILSPSRSTMEPTSFLFVFRPDSRYRHKPPEKKLMKIVISAALLSLVSVPAFAQAVTPIHVRNDDQRGCRGRADCQPKRPKLRSRRVGREPLSDKGCPACPRRHRSSAATDRRHGRSCAGKRTHHRQVAHALRACGKVNLAGPGRLAPGGLAQHLGQISEYHNLAKTCLFYELANLTRS